jgi:hypothetical protein
MIKYNKRMWFLYFATEEFFKNLFSRSDKNRKKNAKIASFTKIGIFKKLKSKESKRFLLKAFGSTCEKQEIRGFINKKITNVKM